MSCVLSGYCLNSDHTLSLIELYKWKRFKSFCLKCRDEVGCLWCMHGKQCMALKSWFSHDHITRGSWKLQFLFTVTPWWKLEWCLVKSEWTPFCWLSLRQHLMSFKVSLPPDSVFLISPLTTLNLAIKCVSLFQWYPSS